MLSDDNNNNNNNVTAISLINADVNSENQINSQDETTHPQGTIMYELQELLKLGNNGYPKKSKTVHNYYQAGIEARRSLLNDDSLVQELRIHSKLYLAKLLEKGADGKKKSADWATKYTSLVKRLEMKTASEEDFFNQENFEIDAQSKKKKAARQILNQDQDQQMIQLSHSGNSKRPPQTQLSMSQGKGAKVQKTEQNQFIQSVQPQPTFQLNFPNIQAFLKFMQSQKLKRAWGSGPLLNDGSTQTVILYVPTIMNPLSPTGSATLEEAVINKFASYGFKQNLYVFLIDDEHNGHLTTSPLVVRDIQQIAADIRENYVYLIKKMSDQANLSSNDFYEYNLNSEQLVKSTNVRFQNLSTVLLVREEAGNDSFLSCSDSLGFMFQRIDILGVWSYLLNSFHGQNYYEMQTNSDMRDREKMKIFFKKLSNMIPNCNLKFEELQNTHQKAILEPERNAKKAKFQGSLFEIIRKNTLVNIHQFSSSNSTETTTPQQLRFSNNQSIRIGQNKYSNISEFPNQQIINNRGRNQNPLLQNIKQEQVDLDQLEEEYPTPETAFLHSLKDLGTKLTEDANFDFMSNCFFCNRKVTIRDRKGQCCPDCLFTTCSNECFQNQDSLIARKQCKNCHLQESTFDTLLLTFETREKTLIQLCSLKGKYYHANTNVALFNSYMDGFSNEQKAILDKLEKENARQIKKQNGQEVSDVTSIYSNVNLGNGANNQFMLNHANQRKHYQDSRFFTVRLSYESWQLAQAYSLDCKEFLQKYPQEVHGLDKHLLKEHLPEIYQIHYPEELENQQPAGPNQNGEDIGGSSLIEEGN